MHLLHLMESWRCTGTRRFKIVVTADIMSGSLNLWNLLHWNKQSVLFSLIFYSGHLIPKLSLKECIGHENQRPWHRSSLRCDLLFCELPPYFTKWENSSTLAPHGAKIKLFQELSKITFQDRRALHPLLNLLRSRGIPYRWRFRFCLAGTIRGYTFLLCNPEDLHPFYESLCLPRVELPECYSSFYLSDPQVEVTNNCTLRAQQWSRSWRSNPSSPSGWSQHKKPGSKNPGLSLACCRGRLNVWALPD